jgi:hypothetical protein
VRERRPQFHASLPAPSEDFNQMCGPKNLAGYALRTPSETLIRMVSTE